MGDWERIKAGVAAGRWAEPSPSIPHRYAHPPSPAFASPLTESGLAISALNWAIWAGVATVDQGIAGFLTITHRDALPSQASGEKKPKP